MIRFKEMVSTILSIMNILKCTLDLGHTFLRQSHKSDLINHSLHAHCLARDMILPKSLPTFTKEPPYKEVNAIHSVLYMTCMFKMQISDTTHLWYREQRLLTIMRIINLHSTGWSICKPFQKTSHYSSGIEWPWISLQERASYYIVILW